MAETLTRNTVETVLSVCATTADRVKDLVIKDGQLIFVQDAARIAFDFKGKRVFYNQIIELETDTDRESLTEPINGRYYFVINTAILWRYRNGWIQITSKPDEVLFIGTELPELGAADKLYVNKNKKEISVWDEDTERYVVVADRAESFTPEDVITLFDAITIE